MNEGISAAEACKTKALTDHDYERLCVPPQPVDSTLLITVAIAAMVFFVVLVAIILMSRRGPKR